MKFVSVLVRLALFAMIIGGVVYASRGPLADWWAKQNEIEWREEPVVRGRIISTVNSTGIVKPVMSVQVGSFVSGPIDPNSKLVEFNQEVVKDEVLAIIDQRIYQAAVEGDRAAKDAALAEVSAAKARQESAEASVTGEEVALITSRAEVERVRAELRQSQNDEIRAKDLEKKNTDFISPAEMDQVKFKRMALEQQLNVAISNVDQVHAAVAQAKAAVKQADAAVQQALAAVEQAGAKLMSSELNLGYTTILSPVDGIVIDRKIEPGQTLAASFQTPELFVIAPRMREEIHVHASVDEADIGLIRESRSRNHPVEFTVDAYPEEVFRGEIKEVRFSSTTTQNVVTYPVVVSAENPELKLLPGMTASISFLVAECAEALKIPNAALRFFPSQDLVMKEYRGLLDGSKMDVENEDIAAASGTIISRARRRQHVWVVEQGALKAIEVETGISDNQYSEVVSGELTEDMKLVTGFSTKADWFLQQ